MTVWQNGKLVGMVPPKRLRDRLAGCSSDCGSGRVEPETASEGGDEHLRVELQASATCHSRLATGGLSLQGKLIQRSVRFQT